MSLSTGAGAVALEPGATLVVLHTAATADIGLWVESLFKRRVPAATTVAVACPTEAEFFSAALKAIADIDRIPPAAAAAAAAAATAPSSGAEAPSSVRRFTMVIGVYFDGSAEGAKASFAPIKSWAGEQRGGHVVAQALNAKKGTHTLFANEEALVSSVAKRLPLDVAASVVSAAAAAATAASAPAGAAGGADAGGGAAAAAAAATSTDEAEKGGNFEPGTTRPATNVDFFDLSAEHIQRRIKQGQGEFPWMLVAPTAAEMATKVATLKDAARAVSCAIFPVTPSPVTIEAAVANGILKSCMVQAAAAAPGAAAAAAAAAASATPAAPVTTQQLAQEWILRREDERWHMEMRLAVCGNVDSGKSTLTSVLTHGFKDDGRGLARARVFNHAHEATTGRTSSISENHLGFTAEGTVVNYPKGGPLSSQKHLQVSAEEMSSRSAKILTLYDLAGHEKYLKTTVLGMTRSAPDYAVIVISANNGIQRMTKEHLGLCLALRLPFFVVVTRIDATPDPVRVETLQSINRLLKAPTVQKIPFAVKTGDDVAMCAKNLRADRLCPIFEVSNVTGEGLENLVWFLNLLPLRRDWTSLMHLPPELVVDSTFFVTGVGTVVGGVVSQGVFRINDTVLIGPDGSGQFRPTQIKSIHVKGVEATCAECGNDAALCLRKERRKEIRKGNVVVAPELGPKACWQFDAEIRVLYHSTTIASNYEPVVHTPTARQAARIQLHDGETVLRTGDHATVRFHFLYRPEYLKIGHRIVFREGRTKGIGTITGVREAMDVAVLNAQRAAQKDHVREKLLHQQGVTKGGTGGGAAAAAASAAPSTRR